MLQPVSADIVPSAMKVAVGGGAETLENAVFEASSTPVIVHAPASDVLALTKASRRAPVASCRSRPDRVSS